MALSCTFLLILIYTKVAQSIDAQCINYKILPRDSERSQNSNSTRIACDDVIDGWYRFDIGEIATSCVPSNHCGTMSTIWMKDPVPKTGETRVNEFCVNHQTGSDPTSCCLFSLHINVTNCDSYMVYQFVGSDIMCPSGYCKGDLKQCPVGQTSPTRFEPCHDADYPVLYTPPVLHGPVVTNNGHDFSQTCDIIYNGSLSDVAFQVTWMFDRTTYKTLTLKNGVTSTSLTSTDWQGNVGKKLSCSVQSYYVSKGTGSLSRSLMSSEYLGAIDITPSSTVISEYRHGTLNIQSSLPLVCPNVTLDRCQLHFDLTITGTSPDHIVIEDGCSPRLLATDWDAVNEKIVTKLKISTIVDPVQYDDETLTISFNVRHGSIGPPIFDKQGPVKANVTTRDAPHRYCMVLGSGEFIGLGKLKNRRIGKETGDFLMFRSANIDGKKLQVHIRNWRPIRSTSSVCAVAFQYGDTLIKVDMCAIDPNMTAPVVTQGVNNQGDVTVFRCGSNYEIVTAEGVRLSVLLNIYHIDIKLHIPPVYTFKMEGACGYDGNRNSFPADELKQYWLSTADSLFEDAGLPFFQYSNNSRYPTSYCQCGGSNPICNTLLLVHDPGLPITFDDNGKEIGRQGCVLIVPRPINPDIAPKILMNTTGIAYPRYHQTTSKYQDCDTAIRHHTSQYCYTQYRSNELIFRDTCAMDAMFTYDIAHQLPSAVQGFLWWCQEETLNKHISEFSGGKIPPEVTSDICSSLCSLRGTCVHGICACDDGFEGIDCSVNKTEPPVILGIKGGQMCAMSSHYCHNPILITRNVYPGGNLQMMVKAGDAEMSGNGAGTMFYLEPIYENKYSVSLPMEHTLQKHNLNVHSPSLCNKDYPRKFQIVAASSKTDKTEVHFELKLSNDGKVYSEVYDYFVYDDKCQLCFGTHDCLQKENTCRINGRCYNAMETNPANPSQKCDPDVAMMHWTDDHASIGSGNHPIVVIGKK